MASTQDEVANAKAYLMEATKDGTNLYDHLSQLLMKLLEEKPSNAIDVFESISSQVKQARFHPESYESPAAIQKARESSSVSETAKVQNALFQISEGEKLAAEGFIGDIPDITDLNNIFEWAGVSLGREETFNVYLAIKRLVQVKNLKSARFFGKFFGLQKDYLIVESERREDDHGEEEVNPDADGEEKEGEKKDEAAEKKPQPLGEVPKETNAGVNRYVYYVCNQAGGEWTRLPDALPKHIQVARKIRKFFTGTLSAPIVSYPPFPGTEMHYLRAQIARISAATVLSPTAYYRFDDEEEGGDSAGGQVVLNTEFEWPTHDTLLQMENWVHHIPYVLPQGRTSYANPFAKQKNADEDADDEEEDDAQNDGGEKESGPPMLTPIAEDAELSADVPAWTARLASQLSPIRYSPVFLRSNRWPGAFVVGYSEKFANIYVGWGIKDLGRPFVPVALPPVQKEFSSEEPLEEKQDATAEEERDYDQVNKKGGDKAADGDADEEEAEEDA